MKPILSRWGSGVKRAVALKILRLRERRPLSSFAPALLSLRWETGLEKRLADLSCQPFVNFRCGWRGLVSDAPETLH